MIRNGHKDFAKKLAVGLYMGSKDAVRYTEEQIADEIASNQPGAPFKVVVGGLFRWYLDDAFRAECLKIMAIELMRALGNEKREK